MEMVNFITLPISLSALCVLDISLDLHFLRLLAVSAAIGLLFGLWLMVMLRSESAAAIAGSLLLFIALMGIYASGYAYLDRLIPDLSARDVGIITVLGILFCLLAYFIGTLASIHRS
jgi:hypothetical protein